MDSQGSRTLKTCFTGGFTAEACFGAGVGREEEGEKRGTLIHGSTALLCWMCPETEMMDEGMLCY